MSWIAVAAGVGLAANDAFGKKGKNQLVTLVKNPEIQDRLGDNLSEYDSTKAASSEAIDKWIQQFLAGSKTATARNQQEQGAFDRYYNGDVERKLGELRAREQAAGQQAVDRSLAYMTRSQSADRIGGGGGGASSYDRRMALGTGADINLQSLLRNLGQERSDTTGLWNAQTQYAGQRTALADADLARLLMPSQAQKGELAWSNATIGDLLNMNNANKMFGVQYKPSTSEKIGEFGGSLLSMYTGGAFNQQPKQQGANFNFGSSLPYAGTPGTYGMVPTSQYGPYQQDYIPALGGMYSSFAGYP